ncbi:MAG: hypothetical protein DWQ08_14585 [Proteobacteria bacterium]|nr:MAG: hypothetical protein DWQ08_14585 [Pseudomonadota bacterium]
MVRTSMVDVDPELVSKVQFNCDLSDARFAGNYTMCIYLLKMREFYRWHHGLSFGDALSMKRVGDWVQQTEVRWDEIENRDWEPLPLNGAVCDVFDDAAVNEHLLPEHVVFSSGIGRFGKPVFFLAECIESRSQGDCTVYMAGKEYARELAAPPAMIRGNRIFLRRQSLERMLWEAVEEWRWHRRPGPMAKVVDHYGFERDPAGALQAMVDDKLEQLLLHEKGEHQAGKLLGDAWDTMLLEVAGGQDENIARAVRDCLADCLTVLPELVRSDRPELIHFHFALQSALGKELFPSLTRAYRDWASRGESSHMGALVEEGRSHFLEAARTLMRTNARGSRDAGFAHIDVGKLAL